MWKILVCNVNLFSGELSKSHTLQLHCSALLDGFALLLLDGGFKLCWQWYHWGLAKPGLTMLDSLSLCTDDTDPTAHCSEKVWSSASLLWWFEAAECAPLTSSWLPSLNDSRDNILHPFPSIPPPPDSDSPSNLFSSQTCWLREGR